MTCNIFSTAAVRPSLTTMRLYGPCAFAYGDLLRQIIRQLCRATLWPNRRASAQRFRNGWLLALSVIATLGLIPVAAHSASAPPSVIKSKQQTIDRLPLTAFDGLGESSPSYTFLYIEMSGQGLVSVSGVGVNSACTSSCDFELLAGTTVTLEATPASGFEFAGWSAGSLCGAGTTCQFVLSGNNITLYPSFYPSSFPLTINVGGSGIGMVTSSPSGINCETTCTGSFASGSAVTLTATPLPGSVFSGWGGAM